MTKLMDIYNMKIGDTLLVNYSGEEPTTVFCVEPLNRRGLMDLIPGKVYTFHDQLVLCEKDTDGRQCAKCCLYPYVDCYGFFNCCAAGVFFKDASAVVGDD